MADQKSLRKAAILLMSLPNDQAANVMSRLTRKQIELVSIELAKLGPVTSEEQERIIHEFAEANLLSIWRQKFPMTGARPLRAATSAY